MMSATSNDTASPHADIKWRFRCRRSGRCCQVKGGVAWVSEAEQHVIAEHMQVDLDTFRSERVRELTDPASGKWRQALLDRKDGACVLLDGANECSVYEARPAQCRDFPFWDSVTGDPKGFERAKTVCPGIEPVPSSALSTRASLALEQLLQVGPSSEARTCPHEDRGAGLHVSGLEADRIAQVAPAGSAESGACPLARGSVCSDPNGQPLACREWPSEAQREEAFEQLQKLETEMGYPRKIGPIPQLLKDRKGDGYALLPGTAPGLGMDS
jgi:hypothetical protein